MEEISFINARAAQRSWALTPLSRRLGIFKTARHMMAGNAVQFANAVTLGNRRVSAETLPLELIPLLDAIHYLERSASRILAPRRLGRTGRPVWLSGVVAEVRREAMGVILVIGPFNYPLFLPGVQIVQALAAGNAVIVKPSPGHAASMTLLREMFIAAGLPPALFTIIDDTVDAARQAIALRPDKIILTGSVATGRAVLADASTQSIPTVMELSGNDAVIILCGADIDYAARALVWGLCLNGGATCIAPRRVFVMQDLLPDLCTRLAVILQDGREYYIGAPAMALVTELLAKARQAGTQIIGGTLSVEKFSMKPAIVVDPGRDSGLLHEDIFAPIFCLIPVATEVEAIARVGECKYHLGAAIFGPRVEAEKIASALDVGFVTINDLIAPTADPRLPFGGHGASGFGATRGPEGLLEMTRAKSIIVRHARFGIQLKPIGSKEKNLFLGFITLAYGHRTLRNLLSGLLQILQALLARPSSTPRPIE